jgi:hypothetical protein
MKKSNEYDTPTSNPSTVCSMASRKSGSTVPMSLASVPPSGERTQSTPVLLNGPAAATTSGVDLALIHPVGTVSAAGVAVMEPLTMTGAASARSAPSSNITASTAWLRRRTLISVITVSFPSRGSRPMADRMVKRANHDECVIDALISTLKSRDKHDVS